MMKDTNQSKHFDSLHAPPKTVEMQQLMSATSLDASSSTSRVAAVRVRTKFRVALLLHA
jgi:hypothetical protein